MSIYVKRNVYSAGLKRAYTKQVAITGYSISHHLMNSQRRTLSNIMENLCIQLSDNFPNTTNVFRLEKTISTVHKIRIQVKYISYFMFYHIRKCDY